MRGKTMVKAGGILAAAVLGVASVPAQAITWNFASFTQGGTNANTFGNSYSSTSEGVTLTVTAFSTTFNAANVNFETANIANWGSGSGFGVRNRDEAASAGGLGNVSSPNHAMDNSSTTDMLLLSFSSNTVIDSITSGWRSGDSDVSLLRWIGVGAPTIVGKSIANLVGVGGGWTLVNHYDDLPSDVARTTGATGASQYWIVSAYNSGWGTGTENQYTDLADLSSGNDYVKFLASVSSVRPPDEVPEPGSIALLALGIASLAIMRRRSKNAA